MKRRLKERQLGCAECAGGAPKEEKRRPSAAC